MHITRKVLRRIRLTLASDGQVRLKIPPHYDPRAVMNIIEYAHAIACSIGIPPATRRGYIIYEKPLRINWAGTGQLQERRHKLWLEDPKCRNCGIETIPPQDLIDKYGEYVSKWPKEVHDRMATLEHTITRFDPKSKTLGRNSNPVTTLFCAKCNEETGNKAYNNLPKEELRRRAGYYDPTHRRPNIHYHTKKPSDETNNLTRNL